MRASAEKIALQEGGLTAGMVFHDMSALLTVDELSLRQGGPFPRADRFIPTVSPSKQNEVRNLSLSFQLSESDVAQGTHQLLFSGMRR